MIAPLRIDLFFLASILNIKASFRGESDAWLPNTFFQTSLHTERGTKRVEERKDYQYFSPALYASYVLFVLRKKEKVRKSSRIGIYFYDFRNVKGQVRVMICIRFRVIIIIFTHFWRSEFHRKATLLQLISRWACFVRRNGIYAYMRSYNFFPSIHSLTLRILTRICVRAYE